MLSIYYCQFEGMTNFQKIIFIHHIEVIKHLLTWSASYRFQGLIAEYNLDSKTISDSSVSGITRSSLLQIR